MLKTGYILTLLVIFTLASLVSTGCEPKAARHVSRPSAESVQQVVFLDQRLQNDLRVEDLGMTQPDGQNRLLIKLKIRNLRDKPIECRVKYKFKSDDGFTVDETSWMPIIFDRREVTQLEQKSLSSQACDFTVLFRYEKKLKGLDDD